MNNNDEATVPLFHDSSQSPYNKIQLGALMMLEPAVLRKLDRRAAGSITEAVSRATPIMEQHLIDLWKEHLQWQPTLPMCKIQNIHTRLKIIVKPRARHLVQYLVTRVFHLYNNPNRKANLKSLLLHYLSLTPLPGDNLYMKSITPSPSALVLLYTSSAHLQAFTTSSAPQALVMLYTSSLQPNRDLANHAIREFILHSGNYDHLLPNYKNSLALLFSKWLYWAAGIYDPLYVFCCSILNDKNKKKNEGLRELANRLLHDLELSKENSSVASSSSSYVGPALRDVKDLAAFLVLVKNEIMALRGGCCPVVDQIVLPLSEEELCALPLQSYADDITCLHQVFLDLLHKLDECLGRIEVDGGMMKQQDGRRHYLAILKELNTISKLYQGPLEEMFWETMKQRKVALSYLIVSFVQNIDDHKWILETKEATNFETRRHLAMMMFPELESEDEEEMHQVLIDRSHLFADSFDCIAHADPLSMRAGLFIKFKNEDAAGPGVKREWFYLVCQAIFNPQNNLFLACPSDRTRFFPNPASKVDPLHLEYFGFAGRVIALALVHNIQVGIAFDRVFFLQLAGYRISMEDIRDADPYLYSSCKKILEMDPEAVDQDFLGLTFVHEVEELVELCPDERSVLVNSKNRKQYVDSLIQHRFVTAVSEQIVHFAQGFVDIISDRSLQRSFFQCLEPKDLDRMLRGSERAISVDDLDGAHGV